MPRRPASVAAKSAKSAKPAATAPDSLFPESELPKDILLQPVPDPLPKPSRNRRIGVHMSTGGGVANAVERAHRIGGNTLQFFSSSPRQWRGVPISPEEAARFRALREQYEIGPVVIHANYLINCCSQQMNFRGQSVQALRGEVERALVLGAEYLVLHPGSWRGLTREEGLLAAAESIRFALDAMPWRDHEFTILIENTAGSEFSLGGSLEQCAELIAQLKPVAPVAACLDSCHLHVAGYDIVTEAGWQETLAQIEGTIGMEAVKVWHCNDAKAARGSRLDRHQHIGQGQLGLQTFKRILNEPRFAACAFVAETPVDEPGDELRNLEALKSQARAK